MNGKFKFSGKVSIQHLNTRKEGPDEDKELAVDIKLTADCDLSVLYYFGDDLAAFLYLDSGAIKYTSLGPLNFGNELENYRLDTLGSTFYGCRVKKFSIEPRDGHLVRLTFGVSFKPSGDEVATIAEYLQEEIGIRLEPANEELDLDGGDARDTMERLNERLGDLAPDAMYDEAKRVVIETQRASISLVQRELRIGYNRAARLIEQMEHDGIVSTMDATGGRRVLITDERKAA